MNKIILSFMVALAATHFAYAYSVDAQSSTNWTDLMTPFQTFFVSMQSIKPSDIPNFNSMTQIQQIQQTAPIDVQAVASEFMTWVDGQLKMGVDWLVSMVHQV